MGKAPGDLVKALDGSGRALDGLGKAPEGVGKGTKNTYKSLLDINLSFKRMS